jgi:hypothetical protein
LLSEVRVGDDIDGRCGVGDRAIDADGASTSGFGLPRDAATRLARRLIPGAEAIPLT